MRPLRNIIGATADSEAHKDMKKRILSAAVLVPVLLAVVIAAPKVLAAIIVGILAAFGAYEMTFNTGLVRHPRMIAYAMAAAFGMPMWAYFGSDAAWGGLIPLALISLLFMEMMISHVKVRFEKVCVCILAGLMIPYLLSSIVRIITLDHGRFMIFIPFIAAFMSDAGAYFIGIKFGKHKLAPVISPKKSIEGAVGGVVTAAIGMVIYCLILQLGFKFEVNYIYAVIYGILGAACGVFGDLCLSLVKRQTGIKDYGNLIPGHGGVLDRFDSVLIVRPVIEFLLNLIPLAVK